MRQVSDCTLRTVLICLIIIPREESARPRRTCPGQCDFLVVSEQVLTHDELRVAVTFDGYRQPTGHCPHIPRCSIGRPSRMQPSAMERFARHTARRTADSRGMHASAPGVLATSAFDCGSNFGWMCGSRASRLSSNRSCRRMEYRALNYKSLTSYLPACCLLAEQ